jgi:hypothetical protein
MPRWGGLRLEPYKPNAVDADNDGIVQEDTAFERPAGTRLLNALGQAIADGMMTPGPVEGLRIVDGNGNDVAYTPRWAGQIPDGTTATGGLPSVTDNWPSVGDLSPSLKDRGLMIGDAIQRKREMDKKRALALPGTWGNPVMARDPDHALELIKDGHFVELEKPEDVVTLTDKLAEIAEDAIRKGKDAPNYGLCAVSVAGTNIFCAEQFKDSKLDNLRSDMPQLGGAPVPGTEADKKAQAIAKEKGKSPKEVDAAPEWIQSLTRRGIRTKTTKKKSSEMHASQKELVGAKVAQMMNAGLLRLRAIKAAKAGYPIDDPREEIMGDPNPHFGKPIDLDMAEAMWTPDAGSIFVSRDGYVIDGHHRWAAIVGMDAADGVMGGGEYAGEMQIIEVDLGIHEVLADARAFTQQFGIAAKAAKKKDISSDEPDTPDVPSAPSNPLQGTIVDDVVHARGSQREKREILDPVMEVFDRVLIAPIKRRPDDQVHVDTEAASLGSTGTKGNFNRSSPDRPPKRPTLRSRRFNKNLRKDAREDGRRGLPYGMAFDSRGARTSIQTGLSHRRARAATPDEIEAQRAANMARPDPAPTDVHVAFPQGDGAWYRIDGVAADVPYVVEPWDGTAADAMDRVPDHDWSSWEAKGYSSEREYLEAAWAFEAAQDEHAEQEQNGWPELKNRKKIKVARTGKGKRGVIAPHDPLDRQLTFAHELFHHFDYGYDPRGLSHMASEIEEILTAGDAVPAWLQGDDADPIPGRAEAVALIDAALNSGSMREYRIGSGEGGVLDARLADEMLSYVESPREIFARAATQWFMATHGSEEQREAARGLARKSVGEVMRNAQEANDEADRLGIEFDTEEEHLAYLHDKAGWDGTFAFTEAEMEIIGPLVEAVLRSWNAIK